ncbi:MAG TPA: AAA family ATPase, partial [Clostridia bacterium]|nr:AAA family ATPase [Clostridia bacterium]
MSRVIWKKLRLTGFGVYKEPVTVEFTEGINVFVAPNETGKTTLMNGLQSVLFGLPASSDPAKFGDTRFRNWDGAASFEGELEFSSGGIDYRIKRLFQDNRFYFQVKENGHWREELSGIHNPSARRPNLEYEGKLESLIGMISRVLFSSTFYLNQPLPETDQLDGEVQSLLSGSGGHYLAALEKLQEETRKLTRYTGTLGVTGRDGRVDGELELVKSRLEELGQAWEESREGADNLQKLLVTARELEDRIESLQEELDQKDRLYQAWERWRFLHNRYRETAKKQLELRQAREKIREIIHKIEEGQENLRSDFPELRKAPEDLAGELENLIR